MRLFAFAWVAACALLACDFSTSPLAGGPGLEPPLPANNEGAAGVGALPGAAGTGVPTSTGGGGGAAPPRGPGDMTVSPDAGFAPPDAGADASMTGAPDAGPPDAGAVSHDAAVLDAGGVGTCRAWVKPGGPCPDVCGECDPDRGVCVISCGTLNTSCNNKILECPRGWACRVSCSGIGVCTNGGVKCADGPCELSCSGIGSCENWMLQCGADACTAECSGFATDVDLVPGASCNASGC